jgi:hypothetical protein
LLHEGRENPITPPGIVKLSGVPLGGFGGAGYPSRMTTPRDPLYAGYCYPAELIGYAVWLYFRFPLGSDGVDVPSTASVCQSEVLITPLEGDAGVGG